MNNDIFDSLFVLELANNHLGDVKRGKKIINDFSKIIRFNNAKAAIKLQFRNVDTFIHKDFLHRDDIRYIKKTRMTKLDFKEYAQLVNAVKDVGCITMATPFDELSVDMCEELNIQIIKIASSDINDWVLIEKIAKTRKPVIVSTGGSSLKDIDDLVSFFERRGIPLAINHCVALYPCNKEYLELNQIDFLKNRYPNHVIGFSTHEYNENIEIPILIAYAKGARTFERHIDIGGDISPYCSLPTDIDRWIKSWKMAVEICGGTGKRIPSKNEIKYLDALVRGVYAKYNLNTGDEINEDNTYLAIPLQKGQLSCRELIYGEVLLKSVYKDIPIKIDDISTDIAINTEIYERGL